jgi:hypothetical protein
VASAAAAWCTANAGVEPGNTRRCEILCGPGKSSGWLAGDERARRRKLSGGALMVGWQRLAHGEGGSVGRACLSRGTRRLYSRLPLHDEARGRRARGTRARRHAGHRPATDTAGTPRGAGREGDTRGCTAFKVPRCAHDLGMGASRRAVWPRPGRRRAARCHAADARMRGRTWVLWSTSKTPRRDKGLAQTVCPYLTVHISRFLN